MNKLPKRILFLTTHNFVTNPRLVKEIRLAITNDFKVEVICFEFNNWSYQYNQQIKNEFTAAGVVLHVLQAGRKPFTTWLLSVATEKIARGLSRFVPVKKYLLAMAGSRRSSLILSALKKINSADWVIGHNSGALWPTLKAAEKFTCQAGFDVEDYHPGEGNNVHMQNLTKRLMQQVLPQMDYVSFAAPLIRKEVSNDLGKEGKNWITILNYFPEAEFEHPKEIEGPLKIVWFSQNIGSGRGLEFVFPVIKSLRGESELHLIGNINSEFYNQHVKGVDNIHVHSSIPQKELHRQLSNYDVGLALEIATDRNRELCLTNKLLAYMQAGLYVLTSSTPAQIDYLKEFPTHGVSMDIKIESEIELTLKKLIKEKDIIRVGKSNRFQDFSKMNWENESLQLLNQWERLMVNRSEDFMEK